MQISLKWSKSCMIIAKGKREGWINLSLFIGKIVKIILTTNRGSRQNLSILLLFQILGDYPPLSSFNSENSPLNICYFDRNMNNFSYKKFWCKFILYIFLLYNICIYCLGGGRKHRQQEETTNNRTTWRYTLLGNMFVPFFLPLFQYIFN